MFSNFDLSYHSSYKKGRKEGIAIGEQRAVSIIKNMLQKGKTPEDIADMTGESLDEILEFAKSIGDKKILTK